jgi:hypothetical protein
LSLAEFGTAAFADSDGDGAWEVVLDELGLSAYGRSPALKPRKSSAFYQRNISFSSEGVPTFGAMNVIVMTVP